jgi:Flavoprotein
MRLVAGITGATGAAIGIRLLEVLGALDVETHLVLSRWARATIEMETGNTVREVQVLAARYYEHQAQAAAISSGSFRTDGMIVAPCSMKTLAAIRIGYGEGLIPRAADASSRATCPSNATPWRGRSVSTPVTWYPKPRCSRPTTSRPSPTAMPRSGRWSPRAVRSTNATPS